MSYSEIIFDVDDTLLDGIQDLADSMNFILSRHGFPAHAIGEYKQFVGNGMRVLAMSALPEEERDEEGVNRYLDELEKQYEERWSQATKLHPGIEESLRRLEESGIRMFALSDRPHHFTKEVTDEPFGLKRLEPVYGTRAGVPKKPGPYSALEIPKLSEIPVSDFLCLNDSEVGMKATDAVGICAVGAAWGFRKVDELWKSGAKAVIQDPLELTEIMKL